MWSAFLSSCHHLTNPQPDRLICCHMTGWLANCSWKAGWLADYLSSLSNKMSTIPSPQAEISCDHVCDDLGHIDLMYHPPSRHLKAKIGTTMSRLPFCHMYPHPTWDCRPGLHLVRCQVRSTEHHVRCTPQLKTSSGHGKMIDPQAWLLHHKRHFTWEGNYLVMYVFRHVECKSGCVAHFETHPGISWTICKRKGSKVRDRHTLAYNSQ